MFHLPAICHIVMLLPVPAPVAPGTDTGQPAPFPTFQVGSDRGDRVTVRGSGATAGEGTQRTVYANTFGTFAIEVPAGVLVADDILTTAADGCTLTRYRFEVTGRADPSETGGPFTVTFGLYDACPGAGGERIPGTAGQVEFPDDARRSVEFTIPPETIIVSPDRVWLGIRFDRPNCGVILGAPALVGYTDNRFHFPPSSCRATLGSFPLFPYGGFNAEVFAASDCPSAFSGYHNVQLDAADLTDGPGVRIAEDLELQVDQCQMVAYEVGVRNAGAYSFDLREGGLTPGAVIPGTSRDLEKTTDDAALARFTFDPPVTIPRNVWLTFEGDSFDARWILSDRDAALGHTDPTYARARTPTDWTVQPLLQGFVGFNVRILCGGEPPAGACCDMYLTQCDGGADSGAPCQENTDCEPPGTCEAVCRQLPRMNCSFPTPGFSLDPPWIEGAACEPDPFAHPCGTAACCTPDETCENLTLNECNALPPVEARRVWRLGVYCEDYRPFCPFSACLQEEGNCARDRTGPGCAERACCQNVCAADPWCCRVRWDSVCVRRYQETCPGLSPLNGDCTTAGLVDAEPGQTANGSAIVSNLYDPFNSAGPGFPCNTFIPFSGGYGNVWFAFEASHSSARLHTCNTLPSADDTLLAVYSAADPTTPETACNSLTEIECSDSVPGCGTGQGSDICATGLTPGETYYVQLATVTAPDRGIIRLDIESPCPSAATTTTSDTTTPPGWPRSQDLGERLWKANTARTDERTSDGNDAARFEQGERPADPPLPRPQVPPPGVAAKGVHVVRDGHVSIQVNVDGAGDNVPGDAANEPSIAVNPTNPDNIVIGWRQFSSVASNFRQAGWAYSNDAGQSWTFPGVIQPGIFRSDPVLDVDADGVFYYYSLTTPGGDNFVCDLFRSIDGGVTWDGGVPAEGGDKAWFAVDRTLSTGRGNLYAEWTENFSCCPGHFTRSTDGGDSFMTSIDVPQSPQWGTIAVAQDGSVFVSGNGGVVAKSSSAAIPAATPIFELVRNVELGGALAFSTGPNPAGLLGQMWIAVEPPGGRRPDNVSLLGSVRETGGQPTQVMFARSTDGGNSWSDPVRVNDDPLGLGAWHWFGTMSVAPTGRIDVIWNDTRNTGIANLSELFYSYSVDEGRTWSPNVPVSPVFDSHVGWPNQNKLGDYYDAVSDELGVSIAYAATFNGEQDVYFLRIEPFIDCDGDGLYDPDQVRKGLAEDCNQNLVPDACERDSDRDGTIDECDDDIDDDGIRNESDACPLAVVGRRVDSSGRPLSDTNENCRLDRSDVWRFLNCMNGGRPGAPPPDDACRRAFDTDDDGAEHLNDFAVLQNTLRLEIP